MVVPTTRPQAGPYVVFPTTPVEMHSYAMTKGISGSTIEATTSKGKEVAKEQEQLTAKEGQESHRLIKKSDFKIVDQMGQNPSKILILSLLLSSEAHHKALLKVLNIVHVMQDITMDQFDDVVYNITASWYLGFNEVELTAEEHNHNKALHISITCACTLISRVLVNTGSLLNVFPKSTLSQLFFEGPEMQASALIVRAFDESTREVIGEVDFPICVGPYQFLVTFQDGHSSHLQLSIREVVYS